MVTDGRFPSAFACLTWKCSPTERLPAPQLQAAPVLTCNPYRKRAVHAGIGHQRFQIRRWQRY